jgi:dipeptidyl aminopeptidase/acylaminoacyl peptidase
MRPRASKILLVATLLLAGAAAAAQVSLEVYGRLPALEDVALSPDGSKIAFVKTRGEERLLVVGAVGAAKMLGVVQVGQTKLRRIQWADNDHLLLLTSLTARPMGFIGPQAEYAQLLIYDVGKHKLQNALDGVREGRTMNVVLGEPMIRRSGEAVSLYVAGIYITDRTLPALFKVDVTSGSARIIEKGGDDARGWLVDEQGNIIAAEKYRNESQLWTLQVRQKSRTIGALSGHEAIDYPTIAGIAPWSGDLWVRCVENGAPLWKTLSVSAGTWGEPPVGTAGLDSLLVDRYTSRVIGGVRSAGPSQYVFFQQDRQDAWDAVAHAFAGQHVRLVSSTDDFKQLVVLVDAHASGPTYMLVNLNNGTAHALGTAYEGLQNLAEVRAINYAAADGMQIPAFLTLPPDRPAKNLPLIVFPHGGPAARDTGEFDWTA